MFKRLERIVSHWDDPAREETFRQQFEAIAGISIDFAVMEQARDVVVIEAPFAWDDVGSWQAVARLAGTDAEGNTVIGRHLLINTRNSIIRSDAEHVIVGLGVEEPDRGATPSDVTLVGPPQRRRGRPQGRAIGR